MLSVVAAIFRVISVDADGNLLDTARISRELPGGYTRHPWRLAIDQAGFILGLLISG